MPLVLALALVFKSVISLVKPPVIAGGFILALVLSGCTKSSVQVTTTNAYQTYSAQDCEINDTNLFHQLSTKVGPYQSRGALIKTIMVFIENHADIWENVDSNCFYEATITRNVPFYGSQPVAMDAYYEFWIFAQSSEKIEHVCIGVNTIRHHTVHFGDTAYPKKMLYPVGYRSGFAKQIRHLPICTARNSGYRYLRD